jgi:hypothetical protein
MAGPVVSFACYPGVDRVPAGTRVDLCGSWAPDGTAGTGAWSRRPMTRARDETAGGRDALKHFVKACHQHGIAVIMDVVYDHYTLQAGQAAWQYDSTSPEDNCYYWYEGQPSQYSFPEGGYLDNLSSGWARYSARRYGRPGAS